MIPLRGLFESHLNVADLDRAMAFYGQTLELELAEVFRKRRVAFYWIGAPGQSMLGLWESGNGPQRMSLHVAFRVDLDNLLAAPRRLQVAGLVPRDFNGVPCDEPVVLGWMPAAAVYFHDPDGNLLEYLCMLNEPPRSDQGVVPWSRWQADRGS